MPKSLLFYVLDRCKTIASTDLESKSKKESSLDQQVCDDYRTNVKISYCLASDEFRLKYGAPPRVDKVIMAECEKNWPLFMNRKERVKRLKTPKGEVTFLQWAHPISFKGYSHDEISEVMKNTTHSNQNILNYLIEHKAKHIFVEGRTKEIQHKDLPVYFREQGIKNVDINDLARKVKEAFVDMPAKASTDEEREVFKLGQSFFMTLYGPDIIYLILNPDAIIHPVDSGEELKARDSLGTIYSDNVNDGLGLLLLNADFARREFEVETRVLNFLDKNPGERIFIVYGGGHSFADNFSHMATNRFRTIETYEDQKTNESIELMQFHSMANGLRAWQEDLGERIRPNEQNIWERSSRAFMLTYEIVSLFEQAKQTVVEIKSEADFNLQYWQAMKEISLSKVSKLYSEVKDSPEYRYWQSIRGEILAEINKKYRELIDIEKKNHQGYFNMSAIVGRGPSGVMEFIIFGNDERVSYFMSKMLTQDLVEKIQQNKHKKPWVWSGNKPFTLMCRFYYTADPEEAKSLNEKYKDNPFVEVIFAK